MQKVSEFRAPIEFVLTDIDDTLTDEGQLGPEAYEALWELHRAGVHVIPITGRPAGWCEMIARQWPVSAVVGENGGFYFRYHNKTMHRQFHFDEATQTANRKKLQLLQQDILKLVPGAAVASDQFCRLMDLAIDFCEDVPALPKSEVQKIVQLFNDAGAEAKVSSIHVNGWFGKYDKLTTTLKMLATEFNVSPADAKKNCAFSGDSPNDEPMFGYFPHSFAVANIQNFIKDLDTPPTYIAQSRGGLGFVEIASQILQQRKVV
jgi:HAD superfamily hydrolase (TIGR01484 family)